MKDYIIYEVRISLNEISSIKMIQFFTFRCIVNSTENQIFYSKDLMEQVR